MTNMSTVERHMLVPGPIAAVLVAATPGTPESAINQVAEPAVKIAKAVEEAAAKSLG
jgi:hypothetical protein